MNRQQRRAAERARDRGPRGAPPSASEPVALGRARALLGEARYAEAEASARELLADGDDVRARMLLVAALREQRRFDEATMEARRIVTARPQEPAAHETLGRVLSEQDRIVEAVTAYERAVTLAPDRREARQGLGNALLELGVLDRAAEHFSRVIVLAPGDAAGYVSLAAAWIAMGRFADAVAVLDEAEANDALSPLGTWNRSLAALGTGDLAAGWSAYETGFEVGVRGPDRTTSVPRWRGEDLSGRTILVWREQGLGDEVRFASCLPDLTASADRVIVEASPRLVPLLARSFPAAEVRAETVDGSGGTEVVPAEADVQAPMGSLPAILRPTLDSFPAEPGFLTADPQRRAAFRDRLGPAEELTVGISWRSMNLRTSRLRAYTTLEELAPLLTVPGVRFVNLQYGPVDLREQELTQLEAAHGVEVLRFDDLDYTDDLDGVAALTAELDLVIGPSSFPVILAGGLGVPAFHFHAPFAWTHGAGDDPWFRATRHFTRRWDEGWEATIAAMRSELAALVSARRRGR